jgi:UDPglucose 6-dehydrogenase
MNQQKLSINIIGMGYVGGGMCHLCERNNVEFNVCDINYKQGNFNYFNNVIDLVNFSETSGDINYYIIAVPTNSDSEGNCDISIVKSVLEQLNNNITKETYVIIKSTIVPKTSETFNELFPELNIVFSPEFLTENNYLDDIYNAKFLILGIPPEFNMTKYQKILKVMRLFYKHNSQIDIFMQSYKEAELFKYTVNNFLAVKVWYFNKIYDISESLGIDYQKFKSLFELEPRMSGYGTRVPGDHGRGYAGTCLKKDQYGLIKLLEKLDIDDTVLKSMASENEEMRKNDMFNLN